MNISLSQLRAWDADRLKNTRAYALLGTPHVGANPKVVRVRVEQIYEGLDYADVRELHFSGTVNMSKAAFHFLPLECIASEKTLAAKTADFIAPASRPPLPAMAGMTEAGAATLEPQTATA